VSRSGSHLAPESVLTATSPSERMITCVLRYRRCLCLALCTKARFLIASRRNSSLLRWMIAGQALKWSMFFLHLTVWQLRVVLYNLVVSWRCSTSLLPLYFIITLRANRRSTRSQIRQLLLLDKLRSKDTWVDCVALAAVQIVSSYCSA